MKDVAYYNGQISAIEDMKIPMLDRAVYFGDGVYDVAYVINGVPYALDDHINRFYNSCRLLEMDFPMDREALVAVFRDMISRIDDPDGAILYWQASRATAPRAHVYPENAVPNLMAYLKPKKMTSLTKPISIITLPDNRYQLCNVKTLNLIPNVMACERAKREGKDEAVFIRDGLVTEAAHCNCSILKDGVLRTAPLDWRILPGISRKHMLELANELGIPVVEKPFTYEELLDADEILISATTILFHTVCECDGKPVCGKDPETVTRLREAYLDRIEKECGKRPAMAQ